MKWMIRSDRIWFRRGCFSLFHVARACLIALVMVSGLTISSGCVSIRHTTNMAPAKDAATLSVNRQFRIEKVEYTVGELKGSAGAVPFLPPAPPEKIEPINAKMYWDEAAWRDQIARTAASRYPGIFTEGAGAYPLTVLVRIRAKGPGTARIVFPLVLSGLVLGGILPLHMGETVDFEVSPVLLLDDGATRVPLSTVEFQRRSIGWMTTFTPLGLIPVPGRSDARDSFTLLGVVANPERNPSPVPEHGFALNVRSCVDALVLSLQSSEEEIRKGLGGRSAGVTTVAP